MKKSIVIVVFATIIIGAYTLVQAAAGPTVNTTPATCVINPLDIARAFVLKPPCIYEGFMDCKMLISNQWQSTGMNWEMSKDANGIFIITSLNVNNVQIPLPEPIYGLPMGDGGIARDVYMDIRAYTKDGEYSGYGYFQTNVVSKGDNLVVTLTPADITQVLPVNVAGYDMIQVVIENFPYGYGWWIENGQFHLSMAPVGGSYHCIVYDMRGNVIWDGMVEPFKPAASSDDSHVGVVLIGNVIGAELTQPDGQDSWTYIPNVNMDCSIPTDSGNVVGKVIFTDVGTGGLELSLNGEFYISVQSATKEGDMPYFELEERSISGPGWYQTVVNTKVYNVGKVVITIIPKTTAPQKVYINLHRFYAVPSGGGVVVIGDKG